MALDTAIYVIMNALTLSTVARSRDCAIHLRDLEIAQYTCAILRLHSYSAQSLTSTRMCRNPHMVTRSREATKNGDFV